MVRSWYRIFVGNSVFLVLLCAPIMDVLGVAWYCVVAAICVVCSFAVFVIDKMRGRRLQDVAYGWWVVAYDAMVVCAMGIVLFSAWAHC